MSQQGSGLVEVTKKTDLVQNKDLLCSLLFMYYTNQIRIVSVLIIDHTNKVFSKVWSKS